MASTYFTLTRREPKTLLQLFLAGIAFAIANQIGNAGFTLTGLALVLAGVIYCVVVIRGAWSV